MGIAAVIWAPVRVLRNVAAQRDVLAGFVVTAVYAALSLATAAASVFAGVTRAQFAGQPAPPGLPPGALESLVRATEVATLVLSVLTPFVWWVAVSLVMQLVTRFFNGEGPLSAMMAVVGVAGAPLALGALFQLLGTGLQAALGVESIAGTLAGLVGGLVALGTLVWHVVLVVVGAALARRIGYGESAGSCAVSCAGCLALIIVVAVVLVGMGILVGTTAPQ
ncbi:MAG TPA: YIP1 family protein [Rubrobacteraceae bacterium]|nr:YIP1 family protein [Rubrobacteraceae bacterium]